jgi:hypothetical protein
MLWDSGLVHRSLISSVSGGLEAFASRVRGNQPLVTTNTVVHQIRCLRLGNLEDVDFEVVEVWSGDPSLAQNWVS